MKISARLFVFTTLLFLPLHARAQGFTVLDEEAEAGGFDVTATLNKLPVEWSLNAQENGDGYRLRLTPNAAELAISSGGKSTLLAGGKTPIAMGAMVIQRRGPRWNVLSGNRIVLQAEDDRWMDGTVGYRGGEVKDARLQPVEEITFDDDFMRVAKEVALSAATIRDPKQGVVARDTKIEETTWQVVAGNWATTGIAEQEQAMVAQSANPFAFASKSKGVNFALAGRPFWSDYAVEVAAKPQRALSIGLAIYALDEKNYLLFEWKREGALAIRAVTNGASRTLVSGETEGYDDKNWYRLKFAANGGVLRAFIDEDEVLRTRTDLFGRGLVGLYGENENDDPKIETTAIFDDLRVRSMPDFQDDFSTAVPGRWQTVAGAWSFKNAASPTDAKGAFAVMGETEWSDYTASADVTLPADATAGLVTHHLKGEGAYVFRVAGSKASLPYAGKAQILKIGGGKSTPLAEVAVGSRFDNTSGRWSFALENGYLQGTIEINGKATRVVDAWSESNEGGRAGLYAQRGAKGVPVLKNFAVEFPRRKSVWASVPEIYVDPKQAETMGEWSTPEGLWLPVSPIKTSTPLPAGASGGKTFWHKGAFWGDQDIRFKLPALKGQALTLILGRVAPGQSQTGQSQTTTPLILTFKVEAGNLQATLTRGAEKLQDGAAKIEGGEKSPGEGLPMEISRRGSFLIVRTGGEDEQSTLLAAHIG